MASNISNPEVVRKVAGHADIKTTRQHYSKVADATDRPLEMGVASSRPTGTHEG